MKKLFNFRPIFFAGVFVCLGVGFSFSVYFSYYFIAIFIILSVILSCGLFLFSSKEKLKRNVVFTIIFSVIFLFSALNMHFTLKDFLSENYGDHYVTVSGKVYESESEAGGNGVIIKDVTLSGKKSKYNMHLSIYGGNVLKIGDEITFHGYIYTNSLKYENRFSANNVTERIRYHANVDIANIEVYKNSLSAFETVREFIGDSLKKGVSEDNYGVAYALLTGDSGLMDYDVLQSFRDAGVAHVFAVSGLHIGFLAAVLGFILKKLKVKGIISALIIITVIFFYCGVCGFSASCLRAGIMFSVLSVARLSGRRYDGLSALGLAATIILFVSPAQLFCTGFQLSFAVVFGILAFSGNLKRAFRKLPDKVSSPLSLSITSFLFGAPICLYAFGNVALISILVNLLLIPVVGIVFTLLFLGIFLGAITTLFSVTMFLPDVILKGVVFIIKSLDFSVLLYGGIVITGFVIFYYLCLIVTSGLINIKGNAKIITACCLGVLFTVTTIGYTVYDNSLYVVSVIGDEKICAEVIKGKTDNYIVISDVTTDNFSVSRISRAVERLKIEKADIIIPYMKYEPDVFNITEKIDDIVKVGKVYLAYSLTYYEELTFLNSFKNTKVYFIDNNTVINSGLTITFSQDMLGVKIKGDNGGIYLMSSFSQDKTPYYNIDLSGCKIIAVGSNEEKVKDLYKEVEILSYQGYANFKNAGANGNYTYKFN